MRRDLALRISLEAEVVRQNENVDVVLARLTDYVESEVLPLFVPFLQPAQG